MIDDKYYDVDLITNCWNWNRGLTSQGYPSYYFNYRTLQAHREVYKQFKGEIPEGFDLHHKCENKKCVNPNHFELIKHSEHKSKYHLKTHCKRGHELIPENCYIAGDGLRRCKICYRLKTGHKPRKMFARKNSRF